ncbi:MAG TPA: DedA family protein [Chloroflexi bacterium]|nr:DedA family protein [Chloroflexota bacterium]
MTDLTDFFLTGMLVYGPLALSLALMLGALGAPLPGTLLVLAAGAFARDAIFNWPLAAVLALLGVAIGDSIGYFVGRYAERYIPRRIQENDSWQQAQDTFNQKGGIAIYLTRFLLTPLAVPTNLIAGSSGYTYGRFLVFDLAGEATWVLLYGSLGYAFAGSWEVINELAGSIGGVLVGVVVLGGGIYWLVRRVKSE